tara:strand:- start:86 stop:523 length:438 start_codon:yes stop_codon:yes gene_type:complete
MKINDIRDLIKQDTDFLREDCNIDIASLRVPEMCSKYHSLIYDETMTLRYFEKEYDIIKCQRTLYYTGKADPEEYQKNPFDLKVLRTDVDLFLRADERLNEYKDKVVAQQQKLNYLTEFTKSIMAVSFNVGNTIKWKKFLNGELG